jgi:hypothetical protein
MVYVLLWFHSYESKFCCLSDIVVLPFFFLLQTFPFFSFCSFAMLCVYGSILSHVSVSAGSRCGELKNRYLHLCLHIMFLNNRHLAYLANFMNVASRIGFIELW